MKTIHFHVGSGRCGSTLIQALFNETAMHRVFAANSIAYDPEIYLAIGPLAPVETFDAAAWTPIRDTHFRPLLDAPADAFFVTQENLFGANADKGSQNTCQASCDAIEFVTEGFETRIVMLVRRQDTYFESLYNQLIKRGETRDFETFLADLPLDNFDWAAIADVYAGRFGRDNVTVLPFERRILEASGRKDFIAAILNAIGVAQEINFDNVPTINPSLAPRVIEVQRLANKLLLEIESHSLANWFEQAIPKSPDDSHSLMSDDARRRVLAHFRDANERLGRDYMAAVDTTYYRG